VRRPSQAGSKRGQRRPIERSLTRDRSGRVAGKLRLGDVRICAPLRQELAMPPTLDNAATVDDADFVGLRHSRQPVSNDDCRASFAQSAERFLNRLLGFGIER
jgi:hypothetical protein